VYLKYQKNCLGDGHQLAVHGTRTLRQQVEKIERYFRRAASSPMSHLIVIFVAHSVKVCRSFGLLIWALSHQEVYIFVATDGSKSSILT